MSRKPAAPKALRNARNGLVWRDGRPRWEPSPASRKAGISGRDLREPDSGPWLSRGEALDVCDGRTLWASMIREAAREGAAAASAADDLRVALQGLQPPRDETARIRRALLADLLERAQQVVDGRADAAPLLGASPRSVKAMVEGYFADERILRRHPASTLKAYKSQATRLVARFGDRGVGQVTRAQLVDWYEDELLVELTVSTANLCIGATSAFFTWAVNREWLAESPAVRLNKRSAPGRLVFWTIANEAEFIPWCDANGFADVADGIVGGLWTGARPGDLCAATLEDLAGETWRFTPEKTKRKRQEALPAIMASLRARLDRRRQAAKLDRIRHLNATPFLWDFRTDRVHTATTLRERFEQAKALFIAADGACSTPDQFAALHVQDTRDTCITRLFLAGVSISRMWTWTGHSQKSIERILRDHYLVLQEEGALDMAAKLSAWAEKQGVALA